MQSGNVPEIVRLDVEQAGSDLPGRDLRGFRVFDRAGVEIGVVDGVLVDAPARLVRLLRVAPRDPLEPDPPHVLVPVEAIDRRETDRLFLDELRERVLSGPLDDPDAPSTPDRWIGLYRFFGVEPFWSTADDVD